MADRTGMMTPPYARSWVNILIDWVERLPGPPWAAYLIALVLALLISAIQYLISGMRLDEIPVSSAAWAFALVGSIWLIHYLDHVARGALRDFAALLDVDEAMLTRLRYDLTVIPARPAVVLLAISAFRTTEAFAFQAGSEEIGGLTAPGLAIRWTFETALVALIFVLLYHTVRQLRLVSKIHGMAPEINLFRPAPMYAFSRLTSRTAIGLVVLIIPFNGPLTLSTSALDYVVVLTFPGFILATALLAFVWPLVGMHRRMDLERKRLQGEVGQRIEAVIVDLHAAVDRRDLSEADGHNKVLASLIAERDLVHRFSTWPWQAGTAGAVISAVLLPIALLLASRLLERLV